MEENLLIEYHQGLLEGADKKVVEDWLAENPENREEYIQYVRIWQYASQAGELAGLDEEADLKGLHSRLGVETSGSESSSPGSGRMLWRIAAILLLTIGLGWAGYQFLGPGAGPKMISQTTGDAPGPLFTLSDGSQVRLNAHSELSFPEKFSGQNRTVELKGEAWFSVSHDPANPFVIRHGVSKTEVLGTQFDVRAYPAESEVKVTVFEGVVRLGGESENGKSIILKKGQTGRFDSQSESKAELATPDLNQDYWRTGVLKFEDTPLPEVLTTLEKEYSVTILLKESENVEKCSFSAVFDQEKIEPIIEILAATFNAKYAIDGNEITILGVNC